MEIKLTVYSVRDLKDVQTIGKQDPYVYIEYGKITFRTRTIKDGGSSCGI